MSTSILFESIPWIFLHIIPTKLEVDGIKYPLNHKIDLGEYSKSYGHHRLRIVFMGFIKTKALIIDANMVSIIIHLKFQNNKWFYYLIATTVSLFTFFSKPHTHVTILVWVFIFIISIIIELLMFFIQIQEKHLTT